MERNYRLNNINTIQGDYSLGNEHYIAPRNGVSLDRTFSNQNCNCDPEGVQCSCDEHHYVCGPYEGCGCDPNGDDLPSFVH